jgi:hypothetical protein
MERWIACDEPERFEWGSECGNGDERQRRKEKDGEGRRGASRRRDGE